MAVEEGKAPQKPSAGWVTCAAAPSWRRVQPVPPPVPPPEDAQLDDAVAAFVATRHRLQQSNAKAGATISVAAGLVRGNRPPPPPQVGTPAVAKVCSLYQEEGCLMVRLLFTLRHCGAGHGPGWRQPAAEGRGPRADC